MRALVSTAVWIGPARRPTISPGGFSPCTSFCTRSVPSARARRTVTAAATLERLPTSWVGARMAKLSLTRIAATTGEAFLQAALTLRRARCSAHENWSEGVAQAEPPPRSVALPDHLGRRHGVLRHAGHVVSPTYWRRREGRACRPNLCGWFEVVGSWPEFMPTPMSRLFPVAR